MAEHPETPTASDQATLYLSGPDAATVADLPRVGFRTRVVGPEVGQASGVKMCTASVYKGTTALWLQALTAADAMGVADVVLADLAEGEPARAASLAGSLASVAAKSGRFVAEMEQIALTQGAAGLGTDLFTAMARLYDRVARTDLARLTPEQAGAVRDVGQALARLRS